MMIDRRVFIQGIFLAATTPVVVAFLPVADALPASLRPDSLSTPERRHVTNKDLVLFTIYGWDELKAEGANGNQLFITMNQSWRTAWR